MSSNFVQELSYLYLSRLAQERPAEEIPAPPAPDDDPGINAQNPSQPVIAESVKPKRGWWERLRPADGRS